MLSQMQCFVKKIERHDRDHLNHAIVLISRSLDVSRFHLIFSDLMQTIPLLTGGTIDCLSFRDGQVLIPWATVRLPNLIPSAHSLNVSIPIDKQLL